MEEETRYMACNLHNPGADRPRQRWLYDVEADLRTMSIKLWRLIAKDRTQLAGILREAKAIKPESMICSV
jgi:hypothetical protein